LHFACEFGIDIAYAVRLHRKVFFRVIGYVFFAGILVFADDAADEFGRVVIVVFKAHLFHNLFDKTERIVRVVYHKIGRKPDYFAGHTQYANAHGMERTDPHVRNVHPESLLNAHAHLQRRFVCKRDCQDGHWMHGQLSYQIRHALS
jgi:hypothetical protein